MPCHGVQCADRMVPLLLCGTVVEGQQVPLIGLLSRSQKGEMGKEEKCERSIARLAAR